MKHLFLVRLARYKENERRLLYSLVTYSFRLIFDVKIYLPLLNMGLTFYDNIYQMDQHKLH